MPYIVAVANQKGGVAKTTTVLSLAGALVQHDLEVLVIDLDPQANLTLALGIEPSKVRGSIAEVLLNSAPIAGICRATSIGGLYLAPSNADMELTERFLPIRQNYESILRQALNSQSLDGSRNSTNLYDFILLDCPPSTGSVTLNALNAAQMLIIPTQPEYLSAHALRSMMSLVRRVRTQSNPELVYRILITMRDRRNRIHRNLTEQIQTTFGKGLFNTTIDIDTKLRESTVAGLPITHYKAQTRATLQYIALAEELIQHVQKTVARPA